MFRSHTSADSGAGRVGVPARHRGSGGKLLLDHSHTPPYRAQAGLFIRHKLMLTREVQCQGMCRQVFLYLFGTVSAFIDLSVCV